MKKNMLSYLRLLRLRIQDLRYPPATSRRPELFEGNIMKIQHLKANQIRAHLSNSEGIHFPGSWTQCVACSQVYTAVTSKRQRALDFHHRAPCNLTPVTRKDTGVIVYIPRDLHPHAMTIPIYKRNGDPVLLQRNREAEYTPAYITPDQITQ